MGNYSKAVDYVRKGINFRTEHWRGYTMLVSALGHLGELDEASVALKKLMDIRPDFSLYFWRNNTPTSISFEECLEEGLRKAGVPEE